MKTRWTLAIEVVTQCAGCGVEDRTGLTWYPPEHPIELHLPKGWGTLLDSAYCGDCVKVALDAVAVVPHEARQPLEPTPDRMAELEFIAHRQGATLDDVAQGFTHLIGVLAAHPPKLRQDLAIAAFGKDAAARLAPMVALGRRDLADLATQAQLLGLSGPPIVHHAAVYWEQVIYGREALRATWDTGEATTTNRQHVTCTACLDELHLHAWDDGGTDGHVMCTTCGARQEEQWPRHVWHAGPQGTALCGNHQANEGLTDNPPRINCAACRVAIRRVGWLPKAR